MATATPIKGRKGGSSSSRTPTEQPDDLQSVAKAKILVALGEGEFAGQLTGKNIYGRHGVGKLRWHQKL